MSPSDFFKEVPKFVAGFPRAAAAPESSEPEIAFVGRSNVGKSSLINALFRARIAKSGATPGRTRMLNFFVLPGRLMVVDLPGYGFAKAPRAEVARWRAEMEEYLRSRVQLRRVFVLVDSRVGLKASDMEMFALLDRAAQRYSVVLTKVDKGRFDPPGLPQSPALDPEILAVSSASGAGLDSLRGKIFDLVVA